jgi:uncharacterized membrane protein
MKRIKILITTLVLALGLGGGLLVPAVVHASPKSEVCSTLGSGNGCTSQPANGVNLDNVVKTLINLFSVVVGIVAVIMIMIAGFRYVTSGGDSSKVSGAKNALIYAIVGLVVVALAQFIVQFVLQKVSHTGTKNSVTTVPSPVIAPQKHYTLNY